MCIALYSVCAKRFKYYLPGSSPEVNVTQETPRLALSSIVSFTFYLKIVKAVNTALKRSDRPLTSVPGLSRFIIFSYTKCV